ncbi:MAG: [Fe-S]-binding protein [Blastocatellia bacterium]|nr:MAG: [Fe-S]-binding protein [Blastocatellia bacterium]
MSQRPKQYWMNLVERDAALDPLHGRQPAGSDEIDGDPDFVTTRRSFLKAAGFSFAGALAANCGRGVASSAIPYLQQPEGVIPGRSLTYASTCGACEAGCGLLVTTRDGRPVKVEGNPDHPLSGGATCAVGQASILGLYDSLRLPYPTARGKRSTWRDVDRAIVSALDRIRVERGALRLLTPTITSPTTSALIAAFLATFKNARHVSYDPISVSAVLDAHMLTHGARMLPRYRFDQADVIVSFDADFLATWISPVEYTRGYTSRRRIDDGTRRQSYHVQIESRLSLTGSNADLRLRAAPGEIGHLTTHLAARLGVLAGTPLPADGLASSSKQSAIDAIAERLWAARARGMVISSSQDVRVQALCNFINHTIGAYGVTVDVDHPSYQRRGNDRELAELRGELSRGEVDALIVAGVNPVYDLPDGTTLAADLRRVPLFVSTAERPDETASLATYVCPDHHYLESWNDAEPVSGFVSLTQPTIHPVYETRSLLESLSAWTTGTPKPALDLIRNHWETAIYPKAVASGTSGAFQAFWENTLERGVAQIDSDKMGESRQRNGPQSVTVRWSFNVKAVQPILSPETVPADSYALVLYPKIGMLDGRPGHNAWLHEFPDPVTKVTWDNYACFSPEAARRASIQDGDVVRVATANGGPALELPAFIQPGQDDQSVTIALGYGRAGTDRFARVGPPWFEARRQIGLVGVNASAFVSTDGSMRRYSGRIVTVVKTGRKRQLASTQTHHSLTAALSIEIGAEPRPIVQTITPAELRSPSPAREGEPDLWPRDHPHPRHHWGMAVDLDACTGCSACVIACQAENNVPVVGQDEVRRGREMHWIRIDRYYSGSDAEPEIAHQPMMCQHCEHAPCETVCPVLATVHSEEGLNQQVYNRCVGTRYCANNCPYKVRRFNWFDYPHEDRLQNLVFNPNVTVRSRGVMEKCTFCVQRIEEAKIEARRTGQPLVDGAIKTACEQVCPAQAIVFGDLNDPNSRVAALVTSRRAYRVLEDLNTRPAVRYLKVVSA